MDADHPQERRLRGLSLTPILVALVHVVVGSTVLKIALTLFKTKHGWLDVILASVAAGLACFVPTVGSVVAFAVMIGVLYWRIKEDLNAVIAAVVIARLVMVPVLLAFKLGY